MQRLSIVLLLSAGIGGTPPISPTQVADGGSVSAAEDPREGIEELHRAWSDAFARRDVEAVLGLLTSDYVVWAPSAAPVYRDQVAPALAAAFAAYDLVPKFEREELLVGADLAVERGWDVQELRPRAGGEPRIQRQRVFLVLRRGEDGKWRFARGMSQPGPGS
jgi:ketosteroid isomerase-like protein